MIYKQKTCKSCGRDRLIVNSHFCLCDFCNKKRLSDKRAEKLLSKTPSKKPYKRKPTGELKMFKEIWAERPHKCFITGKNLVFDVRCFAHILPKSTHPRWRLEKSNIVLLHPSIHSIFDHFHRQIEWGNPKWIILFEVKDQLKQVYGANKEPRFYFRHRTNGEGQNQVSFLQ